MEKYNQQSKCPKCQCEHMTSNYVKYEDSGIEVIERKCTNCSYVFCQLPSDSKHDE